MATVPPFIPKKKYTGDDLLKLAELLDDVKPSDWHVDKPSSVPDHLLRKVDRSDPIQADLRNRLAKARCAKTIQIVMGNPTTSSSGDWVTIIQLYPNADAPEKEKDPARAPMARQEAITIPAADLAVLRSHWRAYFLATTSEAIEKWEKDNQLGGLKTADLSAIARMRNNKERAAALRELAAKEERGFQGYLEEKFGSVIPLLLGIPEA